MNQELSQPQEGPRLPAKRVEIDPSYGGGTMIQIQKGDILAGAGEKRASKSQTDILCAPVDPRDVRILPDTASLYLPWSWYADRLTRAFGPMGWALLPVTDAENNPKPAVSRDNVMYREFTLKADGRFVASAMGECGYNPNNPRMTFGDSVEGAKSNSLSRCCKVLGMAPEIHSEGWREEWIKANAVCVHVSGYKGNKQLWRRKSGLPLKDEQGHANPPCPCEACAMGAPSNARDGKPIYTAPVGRAPVESTPAAAVQKISKEGLKALKGIMDHWKMKPETFGQLIELEIARKLNGGATDLTDAEYLKLMDTFNNVETGAYDLKDGRIVRPS